MQLEDLIKFVTFLILVSTASDLLVRILQDIFPFLKRKSPPPNSVKEQSNEPESTWSDYARQIAVWGSLLARVT